MYKVIIATLIMFHIGTVKSQDLHLSMYDAAPLFLNPAMTGVFEGDWRVHGQYRTQWKSVNFKPYTTGLISFDKSIKKWGIGGQIANYRAGIGNYNVIQGLISAGYTLPLNVKKTHNLSFGLQAGLSQKSVEYQLHTYDNQYVTTNGGGFDNSLSTGEAFGGQSFVIPELNFGAMYYYSKQQSRINPFVGVSVFNLINPKESFFGTDNKLPLRLYAHLGTRVNITESFYVIPKLLFQQQKQFQEFTIAADAGYYLKASEIYLLGGVVYRAKDAFFINLGAKIASYTLKLGYDINTSSLTSSSGGRGGFEISFTYVHQNKDFKHIKVCPRL
jgi:type IX secretion system PorP/SprF family membrane protein